METEMPDIDDLGVFLLSWTDDAVKELFITIRDCLASTPGVSLEYKGRPGVSHSLRARHEAQIRPLFVLVDVIDDDPAQRWLSVCFYADLLSDPEERGDLVPGGLLGEDARCFDADSAENKDYLLARIKEAAANAAR
jgi:hypothetical protein